MGKMFKPDKSGVWYAQKVAVFDCTDRHGLLVRAGAAVTVVGGKYEAFYSLAQHVPIDVSNLRQISTFDTERKAMYAARKAALKSLDEWKKADAQAATLDALAESTNEINAEFEDA